MASLVGCLSVPPPPLPSVESRPPGCTECGDFTAPVGTYCQLCHRLWCMQCQALDAEAAVTTRAVCCDKLMCPVCSAAHLKRCHHCERLVVCSTQPHSCGSCGAALCDECDRFDAHYEHCVAHRNSGAVLSKLVRADTAHEVACYLLRHTKLGTPPAASAAVARTEYEYADETEPELQAAPAAAKVKRTYTRSLPEAAAEPAPVRKNKTGEALQRYYYGATLKEEKAAKKAATARRQSDSN